MYIGVTVIAEPSNKYITELFTGFSVHRKLRKGQEFDISHSKPFKKCQ